MCPFQQTLVHIASLQGTRNIDPGISLIYIVTLAPYTALLRRLPVVEVQRAWEMYTPMTIIKGQQFYRTMIFMHCLPLGL